MLASPDIDLNDARSPVKRLRVMSPEALDAFTEPEQSRMWMSPDAAENSAFPEHVPMLMSPEALDTFT